MRGTTVFERWRERRRVEGLDTEGRYLNPLEVSLGDIVNLDCLDWRGLDFTVTQFRVVTRVIGEQEFPFVDYYLRHRGQLEEERQVLLRFIPLDDPDPEAGKTHTVLMLTQQDAFEHNDSVVQVLQANAGYGIVTEDPENPIIFSGRVGEVRLPYDCQVETIQDTDHDGEAEMDEVVTSKLTLWDFYRTFTRVPSPAAISEVEYLYVEVDQASGWTELFIGEEVDQSIVTKY